MKKYLVDTCIISELSRPNPNDKVISWLSDHDNYYTSVIVIAELLRGIKRLPEGNRKEALNNWLHNDIKPLFENKVLDINLSVASKWSEIQAYNDSNGITKPAVDTLIVATAIVNDCTLVTRNIKDMQNNFVGIINPYE